MTKPEIVFVKIHPVSGPSGGLSAASRYVFRVAEKEIAVEVHDSAVMTRDGGLPPEETKLAAQTFLERELERLGTNNLPEKFVLDEHAMDSIRHRLGLPSRF
jgi:hypothetical protein